MAGRALAPVSRSVAEWIDHLATLLMLSGLGSLSSRDLAQLKKAAAAEDRPEIAGRAAKAAAQVKANPEAFADERVATQLIEELRTALGKQDQAGSDTDSAAATPTEELSAFSADPEMIAEFITEAREHLTSVEEKMLLIEADASNDDSLNAVFRGFHTIKGLAGFLELGVIQEVSHEIETLLDLARNRKLTVTPTVVDVVFEAMDFIRIQIVDLERRATGSSPLPAIDRSGLLSRIRGEVAAPLTIDRDSALVFEEPATDSSGEDGLAEGPPDPYMLDDSRGMVNSAQAAHMPSRAGASVGTLQEGIPQPVSRPTPGDHRVVISSVRIETAKLDHLMNMVGEMVIAQTLISHNPSLSTIHDARLTSDLALLTRITADVQKVTTSMRMVPIGQQFQKTARLVRDLSRQVGKQISLVTSGEDTELDKTIAEELSDPLLHMVRNSIDHGIEQPAERTLTGKDSVAQIRLSAYHQSGQIVIEISDDGRGLNREKIFAKANERGLIKAGAQLTNTEVFQLIFEPGFSTAETITGISGRGVGMDVVKKHVQKLRGRIDIHSEPGRGTTFFLKLPLTLAIIEGLVVVVGENRYIVPIFAVTEMLRPSANLLSTVQTKGEMAVIRGGLLPIVRLHERFKLEPRSRDLTEGILVVCESHGKQFCLFVDDLMGKQEVVIKTLGPMFKDIAGLAGCAVLGDGRVGLILDVESIFKGRV